MEKRSISPFQLFSVMFISSLFCAMMYSNYTVKKFDMLTYAMASLTAVAVLIISIIPLMLFGRREHDCNIIKAVQAKKPILSGAFSVVYIIYFMYSSIVSLVLFSLMISNFINPGLSFFAFFLVALSCCYYAAYKGLTAIGRASALFFIIIFLAVVTSCFSISFRVNTTNYSYFFMENTDGIFDNLIYIIAMSSMIPAAFLFINRIKGGMKKTLFSWILLSNLTVFAMSVIFFGVLGEYSKLTPFPFHTATQMIEFGAFQRLDAVYISLWTIGMFVNISLTLYALREAVQCSLYAENAKYVNPLSVIIIGIISLIAVNIDAVQYVFLNTKIMLILFIITAFIFPLTAVLVIGKRRINNTAAKAAALTIVALLCFPLLTGCKKIQVQDRMFIKGVGIDKDADGYAVTVQYIDNYSDGDKQQNKCIQVRGKSVGEAIGNIKNSSGSEPFLGQNVAMVVGWETAKENMDAILDYFVRYKDTRPTVKLYISETTAEDILTLEVSGLIIPIDHMTMISPSVSKNDNYFTVLNFVNQSKNPIDTPTASVLRVDQNTIKLSSVAAFDGDEGLYMLDENEFITYKAILGITDRTVLNFDGISGTVNDCYTNVIAKEKNGALDFDISCNLKIEIIENPEWLSDEEIIKVFSSNLNMIANSSMKEMLNEKNCDIYSLGKHLKFKDFRKYYDKELYRESLKDCSVNVNVNCDIISTIK